MKKISILIIIVMILTSCSVQSIEKDVSIESSQKTKSSQKIDSMQKTSEITPNNPLEIGSGETCPPYTPAGQVIYDSEWTGEYPEIEKYDKNYATATFGLG